MTEAESSKVKPVKGKKDEFTPKTTMVSRWNDWVVAMLEAKELWQKHLDEFGGRGEVENLPEKLQGHLAQVYMRGEFEVMLEELPRYSRVIGGMKELYTKAEGGGE